MKLRLITSRKEVNRASGREEVIVFAVVDLDKSKTYPANFICLLPKELKSRNNSTNVFVQVFGDEAPSVAKKLLTGALRVESDSDVKMELKRRLKCFEIFLNEID